jgi:outer membrane protein OmpA-like peptidoglycan-associated protein
MIRSTPNLIQLFAVPLVLALATVGCATKRYVTKKITPIDQKVDALATQTDQKFGATNDRIAAVASTEQRDISQVNERISSNELKLGLATTAAQQANAAAANALSEAQANSRRLATESQASQAAVTALGARMANSLNYKLIETGNVAFGFNKSSLTPEAKASLDQLAARMHSLPRVEVELVGFTDPVGAPDYNINLSRKRADAVERYLVAQRVPVHVIHTVGLGEEALPSELTGGVNSSPGKTEAERAAARRVMIRIFGATDAAQTVAGGGQR